MVTMMATNIEGRPQSDNITSLRIEQVAGAVETSPDGQ